MDTKVDPSQCRAKCPNECLNFKFFKNIESDDSAWEEADDPDSKNGSEKLEVLFQASECASSKVFDPTKLSEFEHEKMMKLFKQKAAIAYLISVGCTTHQSLKDMTQYVLENEEPPPFKPKCPGDLKKHNTGDKNRKHKHKHRPRKVNANLEALGSEEPNDKSEEKDDGKVTVKRVSFPQEIKNQEIHIPIVPITVSQIRQKLSVVSFYGFAQELIKPKKPVLRNLAVQNVVKVRKNEEKEKLKKKVLLPPLDEVARKRYNDKVVDYFYRSNINPKNLKTAKQKQEYRDNCRKTDAEWRKYINEWGLYFPYSGFLHLRHKAIKELECSHMAPGMYHPDEYEEIQRNKKFNLQRGFDKGTPRFLVKEEFSHVTPYSYGDGVFKYEKYMRNNGNAKNTNLPQAHRFPYQNKNSDPSVATYDLPCSIDTLLKSKKGVLYPKDGIPWHKRRPRGYISSGYHVVPKEAQPRPVNDLDFYRNFKVNKEHSALKPLPGMADELNSGYNKYKGKFKKINPKVYTKRSEDTPGPGLYDITKKPPVRLTKEEQTRLLERDELQKHPHRTKDEMTHVDYEPTEDFQVLAAPFNSESIGPGTYHLSGTLTNLNGFPRLFKQGLPQALPNNKFKALKERYRGKDVPLEEKLANADL